MLVDLLCTSRYGATTVLGASNMGASFFQPSRRVTVTDEAEKPPKESKTVISSQAEARCKRAKRVGEGARIVIDLSDRVRDNARDSFRVFPITEEVGSDP